MIYPFLVAMSTTRNNTKVCGDNISLLTDTVHSLEIAQEFHFQRLENIVKKVFSASFLFRRIFTPQLIAIFFPAAINSYAIFFRRN